MESATLDVVAEAKLTQSKAQVKDQEESADNGNDEFAARFLGGADVA